jgi:formylmethanofuran dehydrogenase subunit E
METVTEWVTRAPFYALGFVVAIGAIANMLVTWYRAVKLGDAVCSKCGHQGPLSTAGLVGEKIVCKKCQST